VIDQTLIVFVGLILLALAFDFVNGFHDTANSISTVVSTRVLSPRLAVLLAATFNFIAFFVVGAPVAKFIGGSIISSPLFVGSLILELVFSALVGGITWDLITWYLGLPSSSSHALIGGLVGAGVAAAGTAVVKPAGLEVVLEYMVLSPIIGMVVAFGIMIGLLNLLKKLAPGTVNKYFRRLQIISSSAVSFSHGSNDAQKTMGVITFLLIGTNYISSGGSSVSSSFQVPVWVALICYATIALGTFVGGWRIIKTMGMRITHLEPIHGFAAETASAAVIFGASLSGIPVSTTHVVSGSIMGVGSTKRFSAVRWGIARRIVWAWIITIPMSALVAGVCFLLVSTIFR
jgi:inorganic phosphate transporter, PiT family